MNPSQKSSKVIALSKSIVQFNWHNHSYLNLTDHAIVRALERGNGTSCLDELKENSITAYDVRFQQELKTDFDNCVYIPQLDLLGCREGKTIVTLILWEQTEMKLRDGKYEKPRSMTEFSEYESPPHLSETTEEGDTE